MRKFDIVSLSVMNKDLEWIGDVWDVIYRGGMTNFYQFQCAYEIKVLAAVLEYMLDEAEKGKSICGKEPPKPLRVVPFPLFCRMPSKTEF